MGATDRYASPAGFRAALAGHGHFAGGRLSIVEEMDDGDCFAFDIGDARTLEGEGEDGAYRYAVTATLDSRVFEQLILDVDVVGEHDPRPVEVVAISRNPFDFVDEPPLQVPMITPAHQLAEKLHAYTRHDSGEPSSRARDLFDMLVIAEQIALPTVPRSRPRRARPSSCGVRRGRRSSTSRRTTGNSLGRPTPPRTPSGGQPRRYAHRRHALLGTHPRRRS